MACTVRAIDHVAAVANHRCREQATHQISGAFNNASKQRFSSDLTFHRNGCIYNKHVIHMCMYVYIHMDLSETMR